MKSHIIAASLALFLASAPAYGQAMTVLAVKDALVSALQEFRTAMNEATYDAKSVGNSVQANVQNVIQDLDRTFSKNMNVAFDKLNAQELRLAEDAERLVALTKDATEALTKNNFDRARVLMADTDILAYNTSYSLPCRTTKPRIVIAQPTIIGADDEVPIVRVRGNFLLQGKNLKVTVGDTAVDIQQRSDTEIAFLVPQDVLEKAKSQQVAVSAKISGLQTINRKIRFVLGCRERSAPLDDTPSVAFQIDPPITYSVSGTLVTTHLVDKVIPDLEGRFDLTGSNQCDDNFAADQNYCLLPGSGTFDHIEITDQNVNCNSSIGPVNPSGDRCVYVGTHIGGCGANRGPFNTWLGCKGRGWAKYNYKLWKRDSVREEAGRSTVQKQGIPGEKVFGFAFPGAINSPDYQYEVVVEKIRGAKILERKTLTVANPVSDAWNTRVANGSLSIEVN